MRLTVDWLGLTLDVSFGPTAAVEVEGASLDGGTTASTPVGFIVRHEIPADADGPWRTPSWDEPEERGQR